MYHRPPTVRNAAASLSPRAPPILPHAKGADQIPSVFGLPLKYVSLVTLAVQNAALSIVMHYSRVAIPPHNAYSPASAVLLNELLKGSISFVIALIRSPHVSSIPWSTLTPLEIIFNLPYPWTPPFLQLCSEILSPDAWKLSIPAILYVIQNSLQFVAISNLPVASFQVTYQMKILTTAAFSVALLRKRISSTKWLSLLFLAIGVGIVQIQTATGDSIPGSKIKEAAVGSAHESAPLHIHVMSPLKGFGAVTAACFTSGLAGVYFEMVLKGSKADLWVRNIQLSLFSLIPALLPILISPSPPESQGLVRDVFRNFGFWAWAVVSIQVFGGLITAVVIKYSDNILKGFATSLSIILSFLASVVLFDFRITYSFVMGASTVLVSTWMYNQPDNGSKPRLSSLVTDKDGRSTPFPGTPIGADAPILGGLPPLGGKPRKPASISDGLRNVLTKSTESLTGSTKAYSPPMQTTHLHPNNGFGGTPYHTPYPSRPPSRASSSAAVSRAPSTAPSSPRISESGSS